MRFLGVRRDVPAVLAATDVFCLPSVSEAASLTLMEAMAAGVPVVVTDVGGNPEIVRAGVEGLLVPRRDPQALAGALARILQDPELAGPLRARRRDAGPRRLSARPDVERYFDLYRRVAPARASRRLARRRGRPVGGHPSSKVSSAAR